MQLQSKPIDIDANPVSPDATPAQKAPQASVPTSVAALAGSPVASFESPALALQQQLVERMADMLNGSQYAGVDRAVDHNDKWPMPVRLAVIVGASVALWLVIGVVAAQII